MPLISVIMPVYNAESYLKIAIDSILAQSVDDFEFIIVNDASKDSTKQILEQYKEKDSRIYIIDNYVNLGLTISLNKGLQIARGKYIARMDGDDISDPSRFKYQIEFLEKNEDVALVGSWFETIDENDIITNKMRPFNRYDDIYQYSLVNNPMCHGSIMVRAEIMKEFQGYDCIYKYAQDYDLWLRIMEKYKINNLPRYLYKLRIHSNSVSNIYSQTQQELANRARLNAIQRRDINYEDAFKFSDRWGNRVFYYNYGNKLKNKKVVIYGAGAGGYKFLKMITRLECTCIGVIDSDSKKHGLEIEGYIIHKPEIVKSLLHDYIVIASEYWKEIEDVLLECGVNKDKIIYGFYIAVE